jgi:hypothetical protein
MRDLYETFQNVISPGPTFSELRRKLKIVIINLNIT